MSIKKLTAIYQNFWTAFRKVSYVAYGKISTLKYEKIIFYQTK